MSEVSSVFSPYRSGCLYKFFDQMNICLDLKMCSKAFIIVMCITYMYCAIILGVILIIIDKKMK